MKQITELTEQEILSLTDDQIDRMIKLKMAEDGIRILTMPIEPEYELMPEKSEKYYSVNGFTYLAKDQETANQISELLKKQASKFVNYGYVGSDYHNKKIRTLENHEINTIGSVSIDSYYTSQQAYEVGQIADRNTILKKDYEAALKDFKSNEEQADYIRIEIWARVKEVQAKHSHMNDMKYQYQRYLDLAEGNKKIALNFLKKAYSIDEETECYVQDKPYTPTETAEHIN